MNRGRHRAAMAVLVVCGGLLVGCAGAGKDDPFSGTWMRHIAGDARSVVIIDRSGADYRFRVERIEKDGSYFLKCPEQGACTEFDGDAPVYEYRFSVRRGDDGRTLLVDCHGTPLDGRSTPIQWVEQLSVSDKDGDLEVRRIELNGQPRTDPPRRFERQRGDIL